jgi:hypothetical protein
MAEREEKGLFLGLVVFAFVFVHSFSKRVPSVGAGNTSSLIKLMKGGTGRDGFMKRESTAHY